MAAAALPLTLEIPVDQTELAGNLQERVTISTVGARNNTDDISRGKSNCSQGNR